jgi:hypothetical protein
VPTEIDTIPLFWADVEHRFPREVDYEQVRLLEPEQRAELATVSPIHREWIDADADPKVYAAIVALEDSPQPEQVRAMAAAFGEGPLPSWIWPIAPALFALDSAYNSHNTGAVEPPLAHCICRSDLRARLYLLAAWAYDRGDIGLANGADLLDGAYVSRERVRECLWRLTWL